MTDIRVKIDELSPYDDLNSDKSRKNLYEVSKNTGTYSSPLYATNGSRKITQEQLREELNIKEYLVNEVIGKTNGDTLEVDKINVLNLTSNATFTLPTASLAYKGKALIIIQSNVNNYKAVINGAAQGPIIISDFRDAIIFNCVFDGTSSYDWFAISKDDSKICNRLVVVSSSTYTANANDNIQADGYFLGNVDITIPSAGIAGRCIYIHYPNGIPSSNTVNLLGGFSATLNQTDFILIRDNGSNWEAISTSQNVAVTPDLDEVTDAGNTTTNSIEVGGLVVDMPSGSGVAVDITKGGAGEALTVVKTSGSGNVASFTGGTTLISQLDLTTPLADSEIASAATWNGKFNTPTGLTNNYLSKWNGSGLVDGQLIDNGSSITTLNGNIYLGTTVGNVGGTAYYFKDFNTTSKTIFRVDANNVSAPTFAVSYDYTNSRSSFVFGQVHGVDFLNNANRVMVRLGGSFATNLFVQADEVTGLRAFGVYHAVSDTYVQEVSALGVITSRSKSNLSTNGGIIHRFESKNSTRAIMYNGGLAIGVSSEINASACLDLQDTNKGLGLNLVANGSKPTGRKGNLLLNDTNSVVEFTTGTGANWQELAVYKFDELLQITDCNATFATANTGVYFPFVPKCDMNVLKIYYNLQSAGTDTVRVAIYSDSSNTPTTLLVQSSEATTGATPTGQRSITIASTRLLAQTRYWIAIKNDSGASSFLSKNNVYSNNITREGFTSGAFVGSPAPSSAVNAIWVGIGI
jgi:hypothetical protein